MNPLKIINLEAPYDDCVSEAEPVSSCLHACNHKAAEVECGCTNSVTNNDDNVTAENETLRSCDVLGMLCILKMSGKF